MNLDFQSAQNDKSNMSIDYCSENMNTNNHNMPSSFPFIQSHKIKLDDILEGIKTLQVDSSMKEEIRSAIKLLKKFKLQESAKWCSELLVSMSLLDSQQQCNTNNNNTISGFQAESTSMTMLLPMQHQGKNLASIFNKASASIVLSTPPQKDFTSSPSLRFGSKYTILYQQYKHNEYSIKDILNYASSLFDLREYIKCSHILSNYASNKYPTAMFLYYYCEYMTISQKSTEEEQINNDTGCKYASKTELNKLYTAIAKEESSLSPFMLYLYGVIQRELKMINESKATFIKCLSQFPYLWSCWVELASISKVVDFKNIFCEIDDHWLKYFYLANFLIERNNEQESITILNSLITSFPNSTFLLNSLAHAYYLLHEYEMAQDYFEKLFLLDPNRYENVDTYSNILFIKENYCELSNLAFRCFQNDKYRPETCCVIGNYYALKGDHPKAITYFKRAVKLDYAFLPAWTLMGHEFLEMKMISSAIESYRAAVDIDNNDYRAWYGLGQTYEIHQMYNFALYYFINAAKAKPNDSRMWTAVGLCYEKLEKKQEAIKSYEKAIVCKDREGIALYKMAKLYLSLNDEDKAAICFKENLTRNVNGNEEMDTDELIESCLFLAKYYKKSGVYEEAFNILLKLKDYEGPEKDQIHSLMREIVNLKGVSTD